MKTEKEIKDEIRHIKNGIKIYKKRGFDSKELEADLLQLNWVINDPTEKEKAIDEILEYNENVYTNNWKETLNELIKNCVVMRSISSSAKLESFIENLLKERTEEVLKEIAKSELILRGEDFFMMVYREHFGLNPKEGE